MYYIYLTRTGRVFDNFTIYIIYFLHAVDFKNFSSLQIYRQNQWRNESDQVYSFIYTLYFHCSSTTIWFLWIGLLFWLKIKIN